MSAQTEWWSGAGGDAYTQRNRVDWRARIPFWKRILDLTGARSVYEFGCNAGYNLSAIRRAYPDLECFGFDVNRAAVEEARIAGLAAYHAHEIESFPTKGEIAFTAGVLIHVAPLDLTAFMRRVIDGSCRYVLAIEYNAPEEQEIEYRGEGGLLWRRPYGRLYQDLGLRFVAAWEPDEVIGFDNCHAWLMEKS